MLEYDFFFLNIEIKKKVLKNLKDQKKKKTLTFHYLLLH